MQVHHAQMESVQQGVEGPLGMDLDGLWLDSTNPVVAFGVHCVPYPKWEIVSTSGAGYVIDRLCSAIWNGFEIDDYFFSDEEVSIIRFVLFKSDSEWLLHVL